MEKWAPQDSYFKVSTSVYHPNSSFTLRLIVVHIVVERLQDLSSTLPRIEQGRAKNRLSSPELHLPRQQKTNSRGPISLQLIRSHSNRHLFQSYNCCTAFETTNKNWFIALSDGALCRQTTSDRLPVLNSQENSKISGPELDELNGTWRDCLARPQLNKPPEGVTRLERIRATATHDSRQASFTSQVKSLKQPNGYSRAHYSHLISRKPNLHPLHRCNVKVEQTSNATVKHRITGMS